MSNYYITTTLPYVNANPHIGFGMELLAADVLARYNRLLGDEVVFNTGTDEHGQKIYDEAVAKGVDVQAYVDQMAVNFHDLIKILNVSTTNFIRTTDSHHVAAAQELWRRCWASGDIYKHDYTTLYCVGCELEKQLGDLVDGRCPLHPNRELEEREEENYFFRFSKYQEDLLDLYRSQPNFVLPESKYREIVAFVERGLKDFSVSRLKSKMPWGIPVPDDDEHVMYVWFDALVNYISTLGWPSDMAKFEQNWPGVQIAGKDNLRQQSAMWQAMLLSAKLPCSKQILINGFISVEGQKMSKSLGNVISPSEMVERYGQEGARWLLIRLGPVGGDADVSWEQFDTTYTAELANGIGNLTARIAALCSKLSLSTPSLPSTLSTKLSEALNSADFMTALDFIITSVATLDQRLSQEKTWLLPDQEIATQLESYRSSFLQLAFDLQPFLPTTAEKILAQFSSSSTIKEPALFPRLVDTTPSSS